MNGPGSRLIVVENRYLIQNRDEFLQGGTDNQGTGPDTRDVKQVFDQVQHSLS